jgi:transposase
VELKRMTEGMFFVLRPGIPWQAVPREHLGPPSTGSYYFAQGVQADVLGQLWAVALTVYDELKGLEWTWQSVDGAMSKAPVEGQLRASTPRTMASKARSAVC